MTKKKSVVKKPLNQSEVDSLPIGSKVSIVWSGGNGPHEYTIKGKLGKLSVVNDQKDNPNSGWWKGEIEFVGPERPYTVVHLIFLPKKKPTLPKS